LAYDSKNGYVYVANQGANNVSIILGNTVVGTIPVGQNPMDIAYDSFNGYVYVANWGATSVSVISDTSLIATVPVGSYPSRIAFDPENGYAYVTNANIWGSAGNVSVLSGTRVVASIGVGEVPTGIAYDSEDNEVYVADEYSGEVSVISGTLVVGIIPMSMKPYGLLYDNASGDIYAEGIAQNINPTPAGYDGNVSIISGMSVLATISIGSDPGQAAYDPDNGDIYIPNDFSSSISVISGAKLVATISAYNWGGSIACDTENGYVYVGNELQGYVNVIYGFRVVETIPVGFSYHSGPAGLVYDEGNGDIYVANQDSNDVSVISMAPSYQVSFTENGLPTGTYWSITFGTGEFNGSSGSSTTVIAINGTYSFQVGTIDGYPSSPSSGTVTVNGSPQSIGITFAVLPAPGMYYLNFTERGLPAGASWSVSVTSFDWTYTAESNTSVVAYAEWNGNYTYAVNSVSGFDANTTAGAITINDSGRTIMVTFTAKPPPPIWTTIAFGATAAVVVMAVVLVIYRKRKSSGPAPRTTTEKDSGSADPAGIPNSSEAGKERGQADLPADTPTVSTSQATFPPTP
jgi:YVTN family beta-propeller protein